MNRLMKYRYLIGVILVAFLVILNINGSSIAVWGKYISMGVTNTLLGTPREVRSDEWMVLTPLTISQQYGDEPYAYFNSVIRATETDGYILYSLPVKSFLSVLHPFLLGYVFLGVSRGLSFFWCARLIFLFLVTFDFIRIF